MLKQYLPSLPPVGERFLQLEQVKMAEIAVGVAIEVLTKISDLVATEGSRLFRLQEDISWVKREMRHIQSYLKNVEQKQGESERAANLTKDIRGLAFDVEDIMEKYLSVFRKREGFFNILLHYFPDKLGARNFLVEIESIKSRVLDLNEVRQRYSIDEHDPSGSAEREEVWDERRSYPHVDERNITGFEDHIQHLVEKIHVEDSTSTWLRVISITGMPGLGKTTLAKKVYNSVRRRHKFDVMAWIYVSGQPNITNILQDIARQVGLKLDTLDDSEAKVYAHLSQKKYVIVFDDIWDTKTWDAIRIAIPTNSESGSRIILTSRHREVGVYVGDWSSLFELQPLGVADSKKLLETSIGPPSQTDYDPPGLNEIGKKILNKCGGVPLAIVLMAGLLKVKERSESAWNGVLEQMDQRQGMLLKTFALSYTDLPTSLKPCFLYFGMFPEDHEIHTFDLINLWAAEGFIKGNGVREVEDVGEDYLNHLISRNLIQVVRRHPYGKVKSCRIHDILHTLCIQVAKDIDFFIGSTDLSTYDGEAVRRVTNHGTGMTEHISSSRQTHKLRSVLWFGNNDWDSSSKDLNFLRVLYYVTFESGISEAVWSLKSLTYLKLEISNRYKVYHIPRSIINLESLVTLDVNGKLGLGMGMAFPMVIWNMKRLRHLLLPRVIEKVYMYGGFNTNAIPFQNFQTLALPGAILQADWLHKLSKLKTLTIKDPMKGAEKIVELLLTSTLLLNNLETLRLEVFIRDSPVTIRMLTLSGYQNLSNLYLSYIDIEKWPQPDELPPNFTKIVLNECNLTEDPLKVMAKIPKLRVLKLIDHRWRKMVCTGEPGNFPQLEKLKIIPPMDYVSEITIEEGGMPRLKKFLTIREGQPGYNVTLKLPVRFDEIRVPAVQYFYKKVVLKLYVHDERDKQKAMAAVSCVSGVEALAMDMKEKKLTVIGNFDPVVIVNKLRKICRTEILTVVGPA